MTAFTPWPVASLVEVEAAVRLSASEQLYYFRAPVAHVIAYEQRLRKARLQYRLPSALLKRPG